LRALIRPDTRPSAHPKSRKSRPLTIIFFAAPRYAAPPRGSGAATATFGPD